MIIENRIICVEFLENSKTLLNYCLKSSKKVFAFEGPVFEVDGFLHEALLTDIHFIEAPLLFKNGCKEYKLVGSFLSIPEMSLQINLRISEDNPIIRFNYILHSQTVHNLTKVNSKDELTYFSTSYADFSEITEVKFSDFNETVHSFCLSELTVKPESFDNNFELFGPMVVGSNNTHTLLIAYEHGSQVPDAFINFKLTSNRKVSMKAVKGNYYGGFELEKDNTYESIWLQIGAIEGNLSTLAKAYRTFILRYITLNEESRKPYIFYNTWAFQERNKHWSGKRYLDSMNEERISAEIDIAHNMGIDVFVLDTGWYEKAGDWSVSKKRFTDNLKSIKTKLDKYGMKLGLWFNPTVAAVSSDLLRKNVNCITSWDNNPSGDSEIWETEKSKTLCLPSKYHDDFANELIRLVKEIGVTYFKWDAIGQYCCSDHKHYHGNENNSLQERKECYAFQIGIYMTKVVDKLCLVCPEAIVDFDITEGHRSVGLGFLSAGKYFLINNGPYYKNFNIPFDGNNGFSNIFVYPGSARARVCRTPLTFDKWLPSVLFLTHYLPDDPKESQNINIASLILGQNGIWGDLLSISDEGIHRYSKILALYKQVREDITESSMISYGSIGSSFEVREKISDSTERGVISIFSEAAGKYSYITTKKVSPEFWATEGVSVKITDAGKAIINVEFLGSDAKIIFFGVRNLD